MTMILAMATAFAGCGNTHGTDGDDDRVTDGEDAGRAVDSAIEPCDAGPPPICASGPCCSEEVRATPTASGCGYTCPEGTSSNCETDPSAFCADVRLCDVAADCVVTANSCCGECGERTLGGSTAVHREQLAWFQDELCDGTEICPGCASQPNPDLIATCADRRCEVVDLSMTAATECTSDDECRVRTVDCCECGGDTNPESLIAVRADAESELQSLVCDGDFGCPECLPVYPADVGAQCDAGRCALVFEGG